MCKLARILICTIWSVFRSGVPQNYINNNKLIRKQKYTACTVQTVIRQPIIIYIIKGRFLIYITKMEVRSCILLWLKYCTVIFCLFSNLTGRYVTKIKHFSKCQILCRANLGTYLSFWQEDCTEKYYHKIILYKCCIRCFQGHWAKRKLVLKIVFVEHHFVT